jgi:MFS family permease
MSLAFTFRALQYRNYRLFFIGQGTSLVGTWMQRVATAWLVYRLTGSPVLLGVVGFVSQIPTFLFSPLGGVAADRWDKKNILLVTQALAMAQALALAVLVACGAITVPWIIALNACLGIINGFDVAARQSFVIEMIQKREDLGNAIALNSSLVNGARLVGPSITGILIAAAGEGVCFFVNAASYATIIVALLAMKMEPKKERSAATHVVRDFSEGFKYIYASVPMRSTIALLALVSLLGMSYQVLMPVIAKAVLGGGPHTLGFLMGAAGFGALGGALFLASRRSNHNVWKLIPASAVLFGAGLIAVSFSRNFWLSLLLFPVVGCGMMIQLASSNTLLQVLTDDEKRGRVMAFYAMAFFGMTPFGSLFAGGCAGTLGAPRTLFAGGVLCILSALALARGIGRAENLTAQPFGKASREIAREIESAKEATGTL